MQKQAETSSVNRDSDLEVPWRRIALGSAIVAVGCLAAVAILAATKEADVLATVALALAVIAFGSQLVVFIAQSQTTNQQMVQAERLNTDTRSALVEVRATSQAILRTMTEQFQPVLESLIGQVSGTVARAASRESVIPASELRSQVEATAKKAVDAAFAAQLEQARTVLAPATVGSSYSPPTLSPEVAQEISRLKEYPPEKEGRELFRLISALGPFAIASLAHCSRGESGARIRRSCGTISRPRRTRH